MLSMPSMKFAAKQLQELENANRISRGVAGSSNGTLRLSENITSYSAGEDAANSKICGRDRFGRISTLSPFGCLPQARPISWKTLDRIRSWLPNRASKAGWLYEVRRLTAERLR